MLHYRNEVLTWSHIVHQMTPIYIEVRSVTPGPRRRGEVDKGERTVRIQCERLNLDREYEQVEIEIPLSVYNNMQAQSDPLHNRNSANRKSLVNRIKNMFLWSAPKSVLHHGTYIKMGAQNTFRMCELEPGDINSTNAVDVNKCSISLISLGKCTSDPRLPSKISTMGWHSSLLDSDWPCRGHTDVK